MQIGTLPKSPIARKTCSRSWSDFACSQIVDKDSTRSLGTVIRVGLSSELRSSVAKIPEPLPSAAGDMATPFISTLLRASQAGSASRGREGRSILGAVGFGKCKTGGPRTRLRGEQRREQRQEHKREQSEQDQIGDDSKADRVRGTSYQENASGLR